VVVDPQQGQIVYQATRTEDPLPVNAFVLARISVVPTTDQPVTLDIDDANSVVSYSGVTDSNLLVEAAGSLTLTPGQTPHNPNPPNTPDHKATLFLRPGGQFNPAGSVEPVDRSVQVQQGQPYVVEVWANSHLERVDSAKVVVTYPPEQLTVSAADVTTPQQSDLPFKSAFLWLPSLGEPDQIHVMGFALPGALLLLMTLSTFITSRMTTTQSDDPQQKAMMQMMSFMPLMYLFFFAATPAGLVLYWLVSNVFTLFQQFFTTGLGQLRYDLLRLTGRDLQPPWALQGTGHLTPAAVAQDDSKSDGKTPSAAGASRSKTNGANGTSDSTVPGRPQRLANDRRAHPTVGRGRKRGKR
jgi:hypothetical protein